jgi:PAS domain S-box-containing protein
MMVDQHKVLTAQERKSESTQLVHREANCAQILHDNQDQILREYEQKVRTKIPAAFDKDTSSLIDSLPIFLDEMAFALSAGARVMDATEKCAISKDHGQQRADLSKYTLEQVLFEYVLLRRILMSFLAARTEITVEESEIIQDFIQEGMLQAGVQFAKTQAIYKDQSVKAGETMKQMTDSLPILFWWTDEGGGGNHFNKKWFEYTGLQENQLSGHKEDSFLEMVHHEDRTNNIRAREQAIREKRSAIFEERLRRWDGMYRWHQVRATPILDEKGNLVRWFASSSDIHDQKMADMQKTQMTEKLKSEKAHLNTRNTELDRFAAIAAHDLKSPLNSMTQFTELLAQQYEGRLDAEADQYIHFILDAGKRMSALIDNLLEYARAGAVSSVEMEVIELEEVISIVQKNLLSDLEKTQATLVVPTDLPKIRGNRFQICQLFQNLLANAIKFRKPHQAPRIEIACTELDGFWRCSIRDEGIGMNPQHSSRIFELFNRLGRSQYEGSGIGLAVCKRIVESHGGQIDFHSEPERGATFYFTLPKA